MANFTENQYPWPTDPTSEVGTETGGNTRLLFAEQDNYRTQKGADSFTSRVQPANGSGTVYAATGAFKGVLAPASEPAVADSTEGDFYRQPGFDGKWRLFTGGAWTDLSGMGLTRIGTTNVYIAFHDNDEGNSVIGSAGVASLVDELTNPNITSNIYLYYSADLILRRLTSFTASSTVQRRIPGVGDIFYVIPRVISADIAETTENIPIEFLKGSLSANKAQAGAQTYGNGFSIAASETGLQLFLRTICNSRSKDINIVTRRANDADTVRGRRDRIQDVSNVLSGYDVTSVSTNPVELENEIGDGIIVQLQVLTNSFSEDELVELQIDGYDHAGEELREIMLLGRTTQLTNPFTDFYFASPPEGQKTTFTVLSTNSTSGNITINYRDRWAEVTFDQQDSVLLPGWTVEVRKGTIPFTYTGVSPNEASIALSRDTALQLDITTIAFDSKPYTDMGGNQVDLETGKGSEGINIDTGQTAPAKGDLVFVDASETLFTGWQAFLDITEPGTARPVRVPLTDATFSINHQLDQAQLIVGDRRPGPPFRTTLRDVMLDGTILFTRERDWVRLFRNNTDFKNPVVVLRNAPAGGFPYELHIELGLGQLMSSPDPQVSDLGLITQAFNMKFRETMSGRSDDFRFKMITDKWEFTNVDDKTVGGLRIDGVYASP